MGASATQHTVISTCAACGKGGEDLKTCKACYEVKYCNRACQSAHRPQHRKECKLAAQKNANGGAAQDGNGGADLSEMIRKISISEQILTACMAQDGNYGVTGRARMSEMMKTLSVSNDDLFKPHPPKEDCPICMLPQPFAPEGSITQATYHACCGQWVCEGCVYAHSKGSSACCPFCRASSYYSPREGIQRLEKRIKQSNDPEAVNRLAIYHSGYRGLPKDLKKAESLFKRAAELGSLNAHFALALSVSDEEKQFYHYAHAATGGHEGARHNLACMENDMGLTDRAFKHWMIAASAGFERSLNMVRDGYKQGFVAKNDYAATLRAFKDAQDEMRSEQRAKAVAEWRGEAGIARGRGDERVE